MGKYLKVVREVTDGFIFRTNAFDKFIQCRFVNSVFVRREIQIVLFGKLIKLINAALIWGSVVLFIKLINAALIIELFVFCIVAHSCTCWK